jgi:hypothetical protein
MPSDPVGDLLAALSRDTLGDVIVDLRQAIADGYGELQVALDAAIAMLEDKSK